MSELHPQLSAALSELRTLMRNSEKESGCAAPQAWWRAVNDLPSNPDALLRVVPEFRTAVEGILAAYGVTIVGHGKRGRFEIAEMSAAGRK